MNGIIVFLFGCYCAVSAAYIAWATRFIVKLITAVNLRKHPDSKPVWNLGNPTRLGWYLANVERMFADSHVRKLLVVHWDGEKWNTSFRVLCWMNGDTALDLLKANQPIHVRLEEPRE